MENIFKRSRINAGLSRKQTAETITSMFPGKFNNFSSLLTSISKLESGKSKRPNADLLRALSSVYAVNFDELFDYFNINHELKSARYKIGLSELKLGKGLSVSGTLISYIENQKRNMKKEEIIEARKILHCNLSNDLSNQRKEHRSLFKELREKAGLTIQDVEREFVKLGFDVGCYRRHENNNQIRLDKKKAEALASIFNVDIFKIYEYVKIKSISNLQFSRIFRGYNVKRSFLKILKDKYNLDITDHQYSKWESGEKAIPSNIKSKIMRELNTDENLMVLEYKNRTK